MIQRLGPNPNFIARVEKCREAIRKLMQNRANIPMRVVAAESKLHLNTIQRFLSEAVEHQDRETVEALEKWVEVNKSVKAPSPEKAKKELGARLKAAYLVAEKSGKNLEEMATEAGVSRVMMSGLINGTYRGQVVRKLTSNSLNAWANKILK